MRQPLQTEPFANLSSARASSEPPPQLPVPRFASVGGLFSTDTLPVVSEPSSSQQPVGKTRPSFVQTFAARRRDQKPRTEAHARAEYGGGEAHSPDCEVDYRGRRKPLARQSVFQRGLVEWDLCLEPCRTLFPRLCTAGFFDHKLLNDFRCEVCEARGKHRVMNLADLDRSNMGWKCP